MPDLAPFSPERKNVDSVDNRVDPAGLSSFELERQGTTIDHGTFEGWPQFVRENTSGQSLVEGGLTVLRGSMATIETTDRYGNTRSELLYSRASLGGRLLKDVSPTGAGTVSGFTHGVADLPEMVRLFVDDPVEMTAMLLTITAMMPTALFTLWYSYHVPKEVMRQQQVDNPFDEDADGYDAYARGWYLGYLLFFIVDAYVGTKALSGVSDAAQLQSRLKRVVDNLDEVRPLIEAGVGRVTGRAVTGVLPSNGIRHVDAPVVAGKLSERGFQAGKIDRAIDHLGRVDSRHLESLSDAEHATLAARLANSGDADRVLRLLDDMDEATSVQRLLDEEVHLDTLARNYDNLASERHQRQFIRYLEDDNVGASWAKVVGDERISIENTRKALERATEITDFGQIDGFRFSGRINGESWPEKWGTVYRSNTVVVEFTLKEKTTFYRLFTEGVTDSDGRFIFQNSEAVTKYTPEQLQKRYALPNQPDSVSIAEIPEGTSMRTGTIGPQKFGPGGEIQYTMPRELVSKKAFSEDWFDISKKLTEELRKSS